MQIELENPLSVTEILTYLGSRAVVRAERKNQTVHKACSLTDGDAAKALSFCSGSDEQAIQEIAESVAAVILCHYSIANNFSNTLRNKTLIAVDNPRLAFIQLLGHFRSNMDMNRQAAESARIAPTARIGKRVNIGELTVIGENCRVGANTCIDASVVLYDDIIIGERCVIQAGVVIGAAGYGFERDENGELHRFPHMGRVVIEDDVEIGAHACIDRAVFNETRIGRGTKIDDGAYIAHNVSVGRDCLIMAHTVLCGSSVIGNRVEISPGAVVRDKLRIGDDAKVGLGSVVVNDVSSGSTIAGVPARPLSHTHNRT